MSRDGWFRRRTWSSEAEAQFFARLARCRSDSAKAQYLRIQAYELASTGGVELTRVALNLLRTLLGDFPDSLELASAHLQAAKCFVHLGDFDSAVEHFRASLKAQLVRPNVDPGTALEFPWFVTSNRLYSLYDEALRSLDHAHLAFPVQKFMAAAVRALIADHRGEAAAASRHAAQAVDAASARVSGFAYHQALGLVGAEHEVVLAHLRKLAAA